MDLRILGPLEVLAEPGLLPLGSIKRCAVLAFPLLEENRLVSDQRLVDSPGGGR